MSNVETKEYATMLVQRCGKVVTMNGYRSDNITGETELFTLDERFRPPNQIRGLCNIGTNAYSMNTVAMIVVNGNGTVVVRPINQSYTYTAMFTSLSWMTN